MTDEEQCDRPRRPGLPSDAVNDIIGAVWGPKLDEINRNIIRSITGSIAAAQRDALRQAIGSSAVPGDVLGIGGLINTSLKLATGSWAKSAIFGVINAHSTIKVATPTPRQWTRLVDLVTTQGVD